MASPPSTPQTPAEKSHFKPTVTLFDWWLLKSQDADGKPRLAVAGVSSAPKENARRVFKSAAICRRHDVFTLVTIDGVTVFLNGIINKQQTIANGFTNEIATHFQLGFNAGWERGVEEFMSGDTNTTGVSGRMSESGSEEETPDEHIGSTYFQRNGRSGEASGVTVQSRSKISEAVRSPSNPVCWVTQIFSDFCGKWTNKHMACNGLNNEKNMMESVLTASKTANNSLQTDELEVGEEGREHSSPTLHPSLEEGSDEEVSCEEMCESEFPKKISSKVSFNNSISDLVNHSVEEKADTQDFRSTVLQSIGIPATLDKNEKNPESGCSVKHNSTNCSPLVDVGVLESGVTISLPCESNEARVSVPEVESGSNTSQHVDHELGGRQMLESFLACCEKAEGPMDVMLKVHCKDRLDVKGPTQVTTNLPSNSTIDDSDVDDLMNQAPEEKLGGENIGSTDFQSSGRPQTGEENQNFPASEPATEALEILDEALNTNAQTGEKDNISEGSPNQFAGRVSLLFSGIRNRKGKKDQAVGNAFNSGLDTIDSVAAVCKSVRNPLENGSCETARNRMSHLSACSEPQKSVDMNVARILDFDSAEDDMEQISSAKEGRDSECTVEEKKKRDETPAGNKKRKASPSTPKVNTMKRQASVSLEGSKKRSSTPSTVEVNNKGKVSLPTKVDSKKRKTTPSTSEGRMKNKLRPPVLKVNSEKEESLSTPESTAHTIFIPSESLSAGRSRSGRLRLRPLEFWRNQSPVYDKDHGVIGIQERVPRLTPARGSISEPPKRKGRV